MRHFKKLLVFLMIVAMALPLLCACGDDNSTASDVSAESSAGSTDTPENDEPVVHVDVPPEVKDLDGRMINILCWDWSAGSSSILGFTGEVISNEEGDPSGVDVA